MSCHGPHDSFHASFKVVAVVACEGKRRRHWLIIANDCWLGRRKYRTERDAKAAARKLAKEFNHWKFEGVNEDVVFSEAV